MSDLITELFALHGSAQAAGANAPLPLVDPGAVWLVTQGHVDIVALTITRDTGSADLQRTHLLRIPAGQVLFGLHANPEGHNVLIMGYGSADAQVARLPLDRLAKATVDPKIGRAVAGAVDRWITAICELCAGDLAPSGARNLRADSQCTLEAGQSAQPQAGVLWLKPVDGAARFLSHDGPSTIKGDILFPVSKDAWLTAEAASTFELLNSASVDMSEAYWRGLDAFHDTVEAIIDIQRQRDREMTRSRLIAKSEADRSTLAAAFTDLESILNRARRSRAAVGAESALLAACRLVGDGLGVEVVESGRTVRADGHGNPLEEIARASRFAFRRIELRGKWYQQDGGPLLGFLKEQDAPVAIVPASSGAYELHDVTEGTVRRVTPAVAAELDTSAFMFYRTLPDRPLSGLDLARFAVRGIHRDLLTIALIGAVGGLLTLATPVAIGHVFDAIIPGAEGKPLAFVILGLIVVAGAVGAFNFTRNVALIRIKHRSGDALQAAVWERLVNLPARFFAGYTAGDLGVRAMGVAGIMNALSTSAISTIVSSIFSLFAVGLLFYYSPLVALVAVGLVLITLLVIVVAGLFQVRYRRQIEETYGKLAGLLLQFMNGISKLRVAAAEDRAFTQWAARFAHQTRLEVGARVISNNLNVFVASFPVVCSMIIYLLVAGGGSPSGVGAGATLSTGSFLAFVAAFATLLGGMMGLGSTIVSMLNIVPIYARLKPILETAPEVDATKADPGPLRGRIEVTSLSFRYEDDGPMILEDVSFDANPGEFIALVGPSGSGKSTLLRLLLGFEQPQSGSIAYDGFDVAGLDPWRLRRQLGVVLQDGNLLPGDIFTNIVGSAVDLTLNDAWDAARLAGLGKDIEQMPMSMHTIITEGASTLSGGQRQRLMIARALVTKPRLVFFDEATSALDNPTQAVVTESLDRLRATRIVIAHRLSTILNADRIFVLDQGRIVQTGNYEQLVNQPGLFHELVRRQLA
ncbi:MAG: NHLP bacteriocin export ABC transporter permease/ATPase subunit [Planctomycetota bacterium]|jgi:NHLM bacteriocin system ABC transporter ATP-binding protein